jgi:hypothetical protein
MCKLYKEKEEFSISTVYNRGYDYRCKNCNKKRSKEAWPKIKERERIKRIQKLEALSPIDRMTLKEKRKIEHSKWYWDNIKYVIYHRAKERAVENNLPFNITIEDIVIPDKCPLLNCPFRKGGKHDKWYSYSLDKIDNSKGYIKGNVQVITYLANTMKSKASKEELIEFAKNILKLFNITDDIV